MRKLRLTKADRAAIYEKVAVESLDWLDATPEALAKIASALLHFTVAHEGKTREQLLRTVFLAYMKSMIG